MDQFAVGAPDWIVPAALVAALLLAVVVVAYVRTPTSRWTKIAAMGLKLVAVLTIALCLLEPLRSGRRPRPQANIVAVLVDNSQSMKIGDGLAADDRRAVLMERIQRESPWRERLDQDFAVRTYAYDSRLFASDDYTTLQFDGYASSLFRSLDTLATRYSNRPVAALLLFSDGNATDWDAEHPPWEDIGFPVYPVTQGAQSDIRDLSIDSVSVNQSDFEAAPVTLQVEASCTGITDERIVAQLLDLHDKVVQEQILPTPTGDRPLAFRFRFRPTQSGVCFYRVAAFPESQRDAFKRGERGPEASLANNVRLVTVEGRRGPYRVLYVAGRPNWEFKFLRRALAEDDEVELVGLVRIARKEPKFSFRDFGDDGSNPIFQGFADDADDTTEQYDEPVMLRLGIEEGEELHGGFPKTAEDLFDYHAVILDDLEAEFFTQDQMLLLRRFVAMRGGGLLMLGGPDTFSNGGYDRTPLGELAPVYVEKSVAAENIDGPFRLVLSREGWLEPWMRLRDTEPAEKVRLQSMPEFKTHNSVGQVKPGASVLANVDTPSSSDRPAFVVQRFGKGRSAALLVGDLWRWAMYQENSQDPDLYQAWRQMIRWLVADVPQQVELRVSRPEDPARPVQFQVDVFDPEFLPLDNAVVQLKLTSPGGKEFTLEAEPDAAQPGVYAASYWSREDGGYYVETEVTAPDGTKLQEVEGGWTAEPSAGEYRNLRPNEQLLQELAERSGGELVPLDELDAFVTSLPNRQIPITEQWVYPVWHQGWVLAFAIACLCAEWGLRRWKGLP